jgi:hypothetical protein
MNACQPRVHRRYHTILVEGRYASTRDQANKVELVLAYSRDMGICFDH